LDKIESQISIHPISSQHHDNQGRKRRNFSGFQSKSQLEEEKRLDQLREPIPIPSYPYSTPPTTTISHVSQRHIASSSQKGNNNENNQMRKRKKRISSQVQSQNQKNPISIQLTPSELARLVEKEMNDKKKKKLSSSRNDNNNDLKKIKQNGKRKKRKMKQEEDEMKRKEQEKRDEFMKEVDEKIKKMEDLIEQTQELKDEDGNQNKNENENEEIERGKVKLVHYHPTRSFQKFYTMEKNNPKVRDSWNNRSKEDDDQFFANYFDGRRRDSVSTISSIWSLEDFENDDDFDFDSKYQKKKENVERFKILIPTKDRKLLHQEKNKKMEDIINKEEEEEENEMKINNHEMEENENWENSSHLLPYNQRERISIMKQEREDEENEEIKRYQPKKDGWENDEQSKDEEDEIGGSLDKIVERIVELDENDAEMEVFLPSHEIPSSPPPPPPTPPSIHAPSLEEFPPPQQSYDEMVHLQYPNKIQSDQEEDEENEELIRLREQQIKDEKLLLKSIENMSIPSDPPLSSSNDYSMDFGQKNEDNNQVGIGSSRIRSNNSSKSKSSSIPPSSSSHHSVSKSIKSSIPQEKEEEFKEDNDISVLSDHSSSSSSSQLSHRSQQFISAIKDLVQVCF